MTPRSIRRAAERKAAKLARKAARLSGADDRLVSSAIPTSGANKDEAAILSAPKIQAGLLSSAVTTSRAQINRANSLHSTGPRTEAGKVASSRNSLKHGLASGTLIVPGEDPAAFQSLLDDLLDEYRPVNPTEELLVNEMAQSYWLEQRALRLQNGCFTESGVDEKRLSLFLRYQTTHHRAFHKALNTLLKLKQTRAREQAVAQRGFVSQNQPAPRSESRFVSQNHPSPLSETGFLSQKDDSVISAPDQFVAEAA